MMFLLKMFTLISLVKNIKSLTINEQTPKGIHLVFGADPSTQLNIIWWTEVATSSAIVYYSLIDIENENLPIDSLPCNHNLIAKGFIARNLTHGKAIHRVFINNLLPNRRYCYEIASGHATSHFYSFRTAANKTDYSTSFVLNGIQYKPESSIEKDKLFGLFEEKSEDGEFLNFIHNIKYHISNKKVNALINLPIVDLNELYHVDLARAKSLNFNTDYLDHYAEVLSNIQILPTIGNFDNFQSANLFRSMFPLTGQVPFNLDYYSLDLNGAHLITFSVDILNSSLLYAKNGLYNYNLTEYIDKQIDWLENDLKKANENRIFFPWIIIFLSNSIDCLNNACQTNKVDYLKKKLEVLFYEYDVDLIFESSNYIYERTYPTIKHLNKYQLNYYNAEMPIRISIPKYISKIGNHLESKSIDKWSAFKYGPLDEFSFGKLNIINSTTIVWLYLYSNQTLIDSIEFQKNHKIQIKNAFNIRQQFIDSNESTSSFKLNPFTILPSNKSRQRKLVILFIFTVLSLLIIFFIFFNVRKRLRSREKSFFANYSNLVENEFDS